MKFKQNEACHSVMEISDKKFEQSMNLSFSETASGHALVHLIHIINYEYKDVYIKQTRLSIMRIPSTMFKTSLQAVQKDCRVLVYARMKL